MQGGEPGNEANSVPDRPMGPLVLAWPIYWDITEKLIVHFVIILTDSFLYGFLY